jgi:transposase
MSVFKGSRRGISPVSLPLFKVTVSYVDKARQRRERTGEVGTRPRGWHCEAMLTADDLGSQKVAGFREAIEARGATLLFPPPCSPDLHPMEQVFAKLKGLFRRAEPGSRESLWITIRQSLDRLGPTEYRNYLRHCGYGQVQ